MRGTCIFSCSKPHLYSTNWTGNVHSLGYGTNPLTPKNQQQQKNCQMDFLKELIERVYDQVAWKSSCPKLCKLKSGLCQPIGLVKLPEMLSYVAWNFIMLDNILPSLLPLCTFFVSSIIEWDTLSYIVLVLLLIKG